MENNFPKKVGKNGKLKNGEIRKIFSKEKKSNKRNQGTLDPIIYGKRRKKKKTPYMWIPPVLPNILVWITFLLFIIYHGFIGKPHRIQTQILVDHDVELFGFNRMN